mgnify:CR=1 FL=1
MSTVNFLLYYVVVDVLIRRPKNITNNRYIYIPVTSLIIYIYAAVNTIFILYACMI